VKKQLRDEWVKALRSGEYKQCRGTLYDYNKTAFCCLGVLSEIAEARGEGKQSFQEMIGGLDPTNTPGKLVDMNDAHGATFAAIADWIEANVAIDAIESPQPVNPVDSERPEPIDQVRS
jgi:hypothetical protein